jgi:hypothetical protein
MGALAISEFRDLATLLLRYAVAHGGSCKDPVYASITEGRDPGLPSNRYSSCGDLAHWLLMRLGVRSALVNRKEHLGWAVGMNVARLAYAPMARDSSNGDVYAPGDILVIWSKPDATNAHVQCVLEHERASATSGNGRLLAAEAGQSHGAETHPRVLERNHALQERPIPLALRDSLHAYGRSSGVWEAESARMICRVLPLAVVLEDAESLGCLESVDSGAMRAAMAAGTLR